MTHTMCYIIKEWFFILIIFRWLYFIIQLTHWVQLRSRAKDTTITIYHYKPPDRKWAGVWMTSCPEEMVLRLWGFRKDVSWILTIGRCSWIFDRWKREFSFLPLRHAVEFFSDLDRQRWIVILNITRCAARWGEVSIVWLALAFKNCVSLLVSLWIEVMN